MNLNPVRRVTAVAILAIAGVLVLAGPGHAQQNSSVFPWQSGGGGGAGGSSYGGGFFQPAAPAYFPPAAPAFYPPAAAPAFYPSANVDNSRAFYPGSATSGPVRINVTAPAAAKISFDGAPTTQTGTQRRYVSPAIPAGQYSYEIQAVWTENGREVRQTRSFPVQAGDVVQVTITPNGVTVNPVP